MTHEVADTNKWETYANIEAMGGFGKNDGHGGSGGIMYFDGTNALGQNSIHINGGLGDKGWNMDRFGTNAASGTCYWTVLDALLIDNSYHHTDKKTRVHVIKRKTSTKGKGYAYLTENIVANDLFFRRYANVSMEGTKMTDMVIPTMQMLGMA